MQRKIGDRQATLATVAAEEERLLVDLQAVATQMGEVVRALKDSPLPPPAPAETPAAMVEAAA
jgi:hypothetical protein